MSEPIRNKKLDTLTAPTPQNTPAQNAPIQSHAQAPGVDSIQEENLERAAGASIFAQNPKLLSLIEGKLGTLVGKSSGYVESLPADVQRRVAGLKGIQTEHAKLEVEFQEEVLALEKKYFSKYLPHYQRRAKIINGSAEPEEAEVQKGKPEDAEDEAKGEAEKNSDAPAEPVSGIPEFWLTAMKNHVSICELITDDDEAVLRNLTDIKMEYLERPGFRLIFEFSQNPFFSNSTLCKTYYYREESSYSGEFIYDHAEGDDIRWTEGKDLTVRLETKKQRNKNTKQTRVVKKTVPADSFFNFFNPPKMPDDDDEEEVAADIEERLELDYQLGEDIKEKLIPHAIDWFTGEALQYEEPDDDDELGEDFDDEEDEDDDDLNDRGDEEIDSEDENDSSKPKQEAAAECKQS